MRVLLLLLLSTSLIFGQGTVTGTRLNIGSGASIVAGTFDFGSAGVRVSNDGDGAITFLGLGNGSDENLTVNLDDTANSIVLSSSTGVSTLNTGSIGLTTTSAVNADSLVLTGSATVGAGVIIGTAGVRLVDDGDGAVTFLGLGNGSDEDFTFNLDDTSNTVVISSSTGVATVNFSGMAIQTNGAPLRPSLTEALVVNTTPAPDELTFAPDTYKFGTLTALAAATKIMNPPGTPAHGDTYELRLESAASQTLTYDTNFKDSADLPFPAATSGSGFVDYLLFAWDAIDSRWRLKGRNFGGATP